MRRGKSQTFVRKARKKKIKRGTNKKSDLEIRVEQYLKDQKIEFQAQYPLSRIHADIYLPATNTIIEINGCYYHGCGKCYKERSSQQIRRRKKDAARYRFILSRGFELELIWGHEIEKNWRKVTRLLREKGKSKPPDTPPKSQELERPSA